MGIKHNLWSFARTLDDAFDIGGVFISEIGQREGVIRIIHEGIIDWN